MENKAEITLCLEATLKRTREFSDTLESLEYYPPYLINASSEEYVVARWKDKNQTVTHINVTYDSGIALIRDVLRGLGEL